MKKLLLTIAILLGLNLTTFANPNGGGVFGRGENSQEQQLSGRLGGAPMLPGHGHDTNQPAPLGGGIVLLAAFGAAYGLISKRNHSKD